MKALKLDQQEKELLEELERDEWVSTLSSPKDVKKFQEAAKNTLNKEQASEYSHQRKRSFLDSEDSSRGRHSLSNIDIERAAQVRE